MRRAVVGVVVLLALGALTLVVPGVGGGDGPAASPAADRPAHSTRPTPRPATRPATTSRVNAAYDRMGPRQRVGQLFMVGVDAQAPSRHELDEITALKLGNVFLSGRSDAGVAASAEVARRLGDRASWRGVRPFVAVDQEGGQVQTLSGRGFSPMPSGAVQGRWRPSVLRDRAHAWGRELDRAGINLDLAPVADVVPRSVGRANQPIGRYLRELGHRPDPVAAKVRALVRGLDDAGVAATLKHFPGLGRATGNTDSAGGVTVPTRPGDASLRPFQAGVRMGADVVMVSSARYPRLDADRLACYSSPIMRSLLRGRLGFRGVVVSDSFSTPALAAKRPGRRATRFLAAGGTMVLDTDPGEVRPMVDGVLDRAAADPAFARVVRTAVLRVLSVKAGRGLVR